MAWRAAVVSMPVHRICSPPAMQIPRKVSHAYLAAGNRAEMLVK